MKDDDDDDEGKRKEGKKYRKFFLRKCCVPIFADRNLYTHLKKEEMMKISI